MGQANLDTVVSTIDSLLASAFDHRQMPVAIERLRELFDGSKACFARLGPRLGNEDAVATNRDVEFDKRVYGELADEFDGFAQNLRRMAIGQVFHDSEVHGEAKLRDSRVWREWMAPQDMYGGISCRILEGDQSFWFFDVQRGRNQARFDDADVALFERMTPIMRRFAEMRRHIGVLELQRDMARHALDAMSVAVIIVDRSMQLVYANAMADDILARENGAISLRTGRLFARNRADNCTLKQLVAQIGEQGAATARTHLLARASAADGASVSLCAMPMPAAYGLSADAKDVMIVARALEPANELAMAAQQLFLLTEAEAQFAAALASGLSLADAAVDQGVRISTARTHLARIFQKTGTRQQSQVAALLRSAELPLRGKV